MLAFRFCLLMQALLATVLVLHLSGLGVLEQRTPWIRIAVVTTVALGMQVFSEGLNPRRMDLAANEGTFVGKYIHGRWPAGSMVALNTAGSTPFYADEMQYIDMLGLNDYEIARRKNIPSSGPWTRMVGHLKGDGASVLSRKPDFIILGPATGTTPEAQETVYFIGDYEIGKSPFFQQEYASCSVPITQDHILTYYRRRGTGPCL